MKRKVILVPILTQRNYPEIGVKGNIDIVFS
jgi:hypothetical protein